MKALFMAAIFSCSFSAVMAQTKSTKTPATPDKAKEVLVVDAACGQCKFELPGNSCDLAVRIDGKAYFVDGTNIDSHGDAHANDGFCNAVRKANVQGEVVEGRFKATFFQLVPAPAIKKKAN